MGEAIRKIFRYRVVAGQIRREVQLGGEKRLAVGDFFLTISAGSGWHFRWTGVRRGEDCLGVWCNSPSVLPLCFLGLEVLKCDLFVCVCECEWLG